MRKQKNLSTIGPILAALVVFLLVAVFIFRQPRRAAGDAFRFLFSQPSATTSATSSASTQGAAGTVGGRFSDPSVGFSFAVPSGYHAQRMLGDTGETILVQSGSAASGGFQVYITPYSGSGTSITPAAVESEAKLKIANPSPLLVAGAASGLAFTDTSSVPPLSDAWFVYNGYLYQAQAFSSNAALLKNALASWQFK